MVVEEVELPTASAGCVRIKVDSVGVCTSDVYGYGQVNDRRDAVLTDGEVLVMGHEPSGTDRSAGARRRWARSRNARRRQPGRRLRPAATAAPPGWRTSAIDGSWSDARRRRPADSPTSMVVPARQVIELTGGIALELGALAEPLSVGAHAVALASPEPLRRRARDRRRHHRHRRGSRGAPPNRRGRRRAGTVE